MGKKRIMISLVLLLILGGCFHKEKKNEDTSSEFGKPETELAYEKHYLVNIHYPKTSIKELDKAIRKTITQQQSSFLSQVNNYKEEHKAEFNVKYETFLKEERWLSIKLNFYQSIYQTNEYTKTIHYDVKEQKFFDISDVFEADYLAYISDKCKNYFEKSFPDECNQPQFRIAMTPIRQNFDNFVLTKHEVIFYFNPGTMFDQEASYHITYKKLKDYTDLKQEAAQVFEPYDQVLNEPVKHIDPNKPMVAITFDDGPTKRYTSAILDSLKEHNASATFFILGSRANSAPDLLQRMILEGNEIGNHTFSHKQLTTLSKEKIEEEITQTQETIHGITNKYPQVIRPPYGSKNDTVLSCAHDKRIVTWTLDTEDWRSKNTKTIVDKVLNTVKDKDIILMHDLYPSTAEAAIILIPELIDRGYQLVTVSELYQYSDDHQYRYESN